MLIRSLLSCTLLVTLCALAAPARAELKASPFVGFAIPASATMFSTDGDFDFSTSGSSVFGLDLEMRLDRVGWRPIVTYWHVGDMGVEYDEHYIGTANSFGIGVARVQHIGLGSLEVGVGVARESWLWRQELDSERVVEFKDSQTAFLGSLRLSAPLSRTFCLDAVAKVQIADALDAQVVALDGTVFRVQGSTTTFVLAVGIGWLFRGV